jgi:hypothetical protein
LENCFETALSMEVGKENKMWKRYRFKTKSIKDYRPLVFDSHYPWWCSGEGDDYVIIIAFLAKNEDLLEFWDDAFDIEFTYEDNIEFTGRFPKPDYFIEG